MGGPENGNFLLLYAVKMSLRRWVVQKSLKTPLRNIKMALKLDLHKQPFQVYLTEFYGQKITFLCYETNH